MKLKVVFLMTTLVSLMILLLMKVILRHESIVTASMTKMLVQKMHFVLNEIALNPFYLMFLYLVSTLSL